MSKDPADCSERSRQRHFAKVLAERITRRDLFKQSAGLASVSALPGFALIGCVSNDGLRGSQRPASLSFPAVAKNTTNNVSVPAGYSARVLYAVGDPINTSVSEYANDGSDGDFDQRAGDEHDGMFYFGRGSGGQWDPAESASGLLCMNHENLEDTELHANGPTAAADNGGSRPEAEVRKEMNAHGVSVIQVDDDGSGFAVNRASSFNRRITAFTPVDVQGPLRGHPALTTPFSAGLQTRGTLNNCANGFTPWGTYLTCEENWFSYWNRGSDAAERSASENALFGAYGMGEDSRGFSYREWDTVAGDVFARFNISAQPGGSATSDYRNEPNTFGYIVEIDPFAPGSTPQKRTALGRFVHEGCWVGPVPVSRWSSTWGMMRATSTSTSSSAMRAGTLLM